MSSALSYVFEVSVGIIMSCNQHFNTKIEFFLLIVNKLANEQGVTFLF